MVSYLIRRFTPHDADSAAARRMAGFICGVVGIFFNTLLFAAKLLLVSSPVQYPSSPMPSIT